MLPTATTRRPTMSNTMRRLMLGTLALALVFAVTATPAHASKKKKSADDKTTTATTTAPARDSKGHFVKKGTTPTTTAAKPMPAAQPMQASSGPMRDSKGHFVQKNA